LLPWPLEITVRTSKHHRPPTTEDLTFHTSEHGGHGEQVTMNIVGCWLPRQPWAVQRVTVHIPALQSSSSTSTSVQKSFLYWATIPSSTKKSCWPFRRNCAVGFISMGGYWC